MLTVTLPDASGLRAIPSTADFRPIPWPMPQPKAAIAMPNPAAVTQAIKNSSACPRETGIVKTSYGGW